MVKKVCKKIRESIINFNANPVNSFGVFLPVAISIIAFISGVVSYVMFIINGGYTEQVEEVKSFGLFAGYEEKFTIGNAETMISGGVGIVIAFLIGVEFVLMMINYFRNNTRLKRVVMIIDLLFLSIQTYFATMIWGIAVGKVHVSDETAYEAYVHFVDVLNFLDKYEIPIMLIIFIFAVSMLALGLGFIALVMTTDECSWMVQYTAISLIISYLLIPLVLLFLENVIPLVTGAMAVVIIIVIIVIAIAIFLMMLSMAGDGETGTNVASSGGSAGAAYSNRWEDTDKKMPAHTIVREKDCAYIPDYKKALGFKLYKVKGITHDYVESDNGMTTREVCDLEMLKKGKFHIYEAETKREIKESEIPWR